MWNTNFRYWYQGSWGSRVRLWTFKDKANKEAAFLTNSLEARLPMLVAVASGKGGNLPAEQRGVSSSRKGVVVTAFDDNYGNDGETLLRIWEQSGNSGELTITVPPEMMITKAQAVNLRGEKIGNSIPVKGGKFQFILVKYAPASFILK